MMSTKTEKCTTCQRIENMELSEAQDTVGGTGNSQCCVAFPRHLRRCPRVQLPFGVGASHI